MSSNPHQHSDKDDTYDDKVEAGQDRL